MCFVLFLVILAYYLIVEKLFVTTVINFIKEYFEKSINEDMRNILKVCEVLRFLKSEFYFNVNLEVGKGLRLN